MTEVKRPVSQEDGVKKEKIHPSKFYGVIVPTVTPFSEDGQLDTKGIFNLTDYVINQGVHGLFPLGTTGESDILPTDLKSRIIESFVKAADGRVPVLAGISQPTIEETIEFSQKAIDLGADALVIKPLYMSGDPTENMRVFFSTFPNFPIMLYNIPGSHSTEWSGQNMPYEVVQAIYGNSNFIGVKDSSNDQEYSLGLINVINEVSGEAGLWQGFPNLALTSLRAGGVGLVQSLANTQPDLFTSLYSAIEEKRPTELADAKQEAIDSLFAQIPFNPNHVPTIKSQLVDMGIISSAKMYLKFSSS